MSRTSNSQLQFVNLFLFSSSNWHRLLGAHSAISNNYSSLNFKSKNLIILQIFHKFQSLSPHSLKIRIFLVVDIKMESHINRKSIMIKKIKNNNLKGYKIAKKKINKPQNPNLYQNKNNQWKKKPKRKRKKSGKIEKIKKKFKKVNLYLL